MAVPSRDEQANAFLNSDAIDDEFFVSIVETKLNISRDDFKLRLVLLSPATGKNENFVSVLYRAKIKFEIIATKERQTIDVIIKALLTTIKEFKEFSVFPRERFIYEEILDSFEGIWLDRTGEAIQFGPRLIKIETDPYEIIVLDDLKVAGYEMLDRKVGLNMAQTKMFLSKLAKFHATSAIRYQKDGVINQKFFDRKAAFPEMKEDSPFVASFLKIFEAFGAAIRSYGDCDQYADKIQKWDKQKLFTTFVDVACPMRCGFQVLNHGDSWLNNMMFKSDAEGNPIDVSLIDYQASFWASPANDILYFLTSSVADDIKVEHFDNLVAYYHSELCDALKKLEYDQPIPSLLELHIDLLEKGAIACSTIMFVMFIVKYDSAEEISIEVLMASGGDPKMLDRIYKNETYKKAIRSWLPFLSKRGFLDTMCMSEGPKADKDQNAAATGESESTEGFETVEKVVAAEA